MVISERAQAKEVVRREVNEIRSELYNLISPFRSQDIIRPPGRSLLRELVAAPLPVTRPTTSHGFHPSVNRTEYGTTPGNNGGPRTVSTSNPSLSSGVSAGVVHESQSLLPSILDGNPVRALVPFPLSERAREVALRSSASQRTGTSRRSRFSPVVTENSDRDPDIPAYQYNPETFRYSELTLRQACSVMPTFDMDRHFRKIVSTLCKYSIRIYGLEDCEPRDLTLAVFFLIEKYFNFQPGIELCLRGISDSIETNVTGVVFERTTSTQYIMENIRFLSNSPYKIERNFDTAWITENLDY